MYDPLRRKMAVCHWFQCTRRAPPSLTVTIDTTQSPLRAMRFIPNKHHHQKQRQITNNNTQQTRRDTTVVAALIHRGRRRSTEVAARASTIERLQPAVATRKLTTSATTTRRKVVKVCFINHIIMGALVTTLAFPVPRKELSAHLLIARGNQLVKLQTKNSNLNITAISIQTKRINSTTLAGNSKPYTIIYSHGNAEDVGLSLYYLDRLVEELQCNVFAYEYPGYSLSEGTPNEQYCYDAIESAYEYVTQTLQVSPSNVILFGRSLGTGPTVDLAFKLYTNKIKINTNTTNTSENEQSSSSTTNTNTSQANAPLGGIILQSPLESGIRAVIGYYTSYGLYLIDIFRNYEKIDKVGCSAFIIHGTRDVVVPCDNGRALYDALVKHQSPSKLYNPLWINNVGHNDMPDHIIIPSIKQFLYFVTKQQQDEKVKEAQKQQAQVAVEDEKKQVDKDDESSIANIKENDCWG